MVNKTSFTEPPNGKPRQFDTEYELKKEAEQKDRHGDQEGGYNKGKPVDPRVSMDGGENWMVNVKKTYTRASK